MNVEVEQLDPLTPSDSSIRPSKVSVGRISGLIAGAPPSVPSSIAALSRSRCAAVRALAMMRPSAKTSVPATWSR
ncbi:hypothetical protein ACFSZS_12045 [Seohaeicola zhoushanensis]